MYSTILSLTSALDGVGGQRQAQAALPPGKTRDTVAYPGILFGGGLTNSVEDRGQRERGSGAGRPLVRGSGGSCNLVKEISFHIVKFS